MSCSQEIGDAYRSLSRRYGVDLDELVYGVDGFIYTVYPTEWNEVFSKLKGIEAPLTESNKNNRTNFCGDIIYCERLWDEFTVWLSEVRHINLYSREEENSYAF